MQTKCGIASEVESVSSSSLLPIAYSSARHPEFFVRNNKDERKFLPQKEE
jgi:hypothetical protein